MADIARAAGISKALLYHYFPSKKEYFHATLAVAAEHLRELTEPDPELPPIDALRSSLEAYLGWIEQNQLAYTKLIQGATSPGSSTTITRASNCATCFSERCSGRWRPPAGPS